MSLIGIVLMGGKSSRMGVDKSQLLSCLRYNSADGGITSSKGRTQQTDKKLTMAELAHSKLKCYVDQVYYSINENQKSLGIEHTIIDEHAEEGPLSGIISALRATQSSILVLDVGMLLITKKSLKNLIKHRNWDLLTTAWYRE